MNKALSPLLQISLCTFGYLYATSNTALAQVTSDGTVNTQVNQNGNVAEITGGEARGSNLFHSFQDFSVPTGNEAFFDNASDISNIFSRVTGGNISNIDGLIRSNGSASLFLINPAGIIFGKGARLDIGGSFYGSTASSILFDNGEFSAADLENPPLLTVNAPIGLGFRDEPGAIINDGANLVVNENETISLIGGKIEIKNSGNIFTPSGRIELASASGNQTVRLTPIDDTWLSSYEEVESFGDIELSQSATVNASGAVSGVLQIQGRNLTLTEGSRILANIDGNAADSAISGSISINATDTVILDGEDSQGLSSRITSDVNAGAEGDAGGLNITTGSLSATNGGRISATTRGQGNAGSISINATDTVILDGENSQGFSSGITSDVNAGAEGDAGGLNITTGSLSATNGGRISANTRGQGNAGSVIVNATDMITLDGEDSSSFPSVIVSSVNEGAVGNAGDIIINTGSLRAINGARVAASTVERGDSGSVTINASESIELRDKSPSSKIFPSGIFSGTAEFNGNGGDINIVTNQLMISDAATITAGNFPPDARFEPGTGEPGNINIEANSIRLTNGSIDIATQSPISDGANITLKIADNLILRDNSFISARAFQDADGGNVTIDSRFIVVFPDGNNDIVASAERGQGGNININVESLFGIQERPLNNSSNDINASSEFSLDGTVTINTPDLNPLQGATELPKNLVELGKTTTQTCQFNRETESKNDLTIEGKGGIVPDPASPFNSLNATIDGEINPTSTIPAPIETAQGKIQPARGVEITPSGKVILTAYRTNNSGDRLPEIKPNCS